MITLASRFNGLFFIALFVLSLLTLPFITTAQPAKVPEATVFNVSDSVVMLKHAHGSNITCIALDDGLYFVDTGLDTENAAQFRAKMEKRFQKKTAALLVTHGHLDHLMGMAAFADVKVVAPAPGKEMFKMQMGIKDNQRAVAMWSGMFPSFADSLKAAKLFEPTQWFEKEITFGTPANSIVFTTTGGHSSDSSSVYYAREKVLVSGDLVQVDQYPFFGDPTNDFTKWLGAFKTWQSMSIVKVCPGHGRVVDKAYMKQMNDYFEALIAKVKELKSKNIEVREVVRHADLPKGYWSDELPRPRWWDYCIASLYRTL